MKRHLGNLLLALATVCLMAGLFEAVGHALLRPSSAAFASLLGHDLPPFRVVPACDERPAPPPPAASTAPPRLPAADSRPALSDLTGLYRDDPVLGYAPLENAVSPHGWWQVNNLGARERNPAAATPPPGERRLVIFGESFGAGSRVRQEQTWSAVMAGALPGTEALNFAVDGYGMGQAYLRFRGLRDRLRYDVALMMFVPGADLGRDINVYRPLMAWDWGVFTLMPRFVAGNGKLTLVPRPDQSRARLRAENCRSMSAALRAHLARYDRFYSEARYGEGPPILRHSVLYRLGAGVYAHFLRRRIESRMARLDSEAFEVSRAIFRGMNDDARRDGARFVLLVLPLESEVNRFRASGAFRDRWRAMVASLCGGVACVDLAPDLAAAPPDRLDRGYDGTHYGLRAERLIGRSVARHLTQENVLAEDARAPAGGTPGGTPGGTQ